VGKRKKVGDKMETIYLSLSDPEFINQWIDYKYKPNIRVEWVSQHKILLMPPPSYAMESFPHNPRLRVFMNSEFVDLTPEEAYHLSMGDPKLTVQIPFLKGRYDFNASRLRSLKLRIEILD